MTTIYMNCPAPLTAVDCSRLHPAHCAHCSTEPYLMELAVVDRNSRFTLGLLRRLALGVTVVYSFQHTDINVFI